MPEQLRTSESKAQNPQCEPLTLKHCAMKCERVLNEVAGDEVAGDEVVTDTQTSEVKLIPVEETLGRVNDVESCHAETPKNVDIEKQALTVKNVSVLEAVDSCGLASQNGLSRNTGVPNGKASDIPGHQMVEAIQVVAVNDSGQLTYEDERSSRIMINKKAKDSVASSWFLRSKSQEKPNSPEPSESVKEGSANGEKKKRGRKKQQAGKSIVNEFSRTRNQLKYLLHRIKYEQSLIDAYSTEGWKGQSLEKLKPEKELQRAKSHILHYKLKIRTLFEKLGHTLAVGKLPESLFDSEGEISSEDIFCAKCGSKDLTLDNDIILCDGSCERGFHQFCLDPPLLKEDIPPGDEGWLCPGCDCKLDFIDMLKDFHSTKVSLSDSWEKIFPEAAVAASGNKLNDGSESSDDSEDDDYNPDKLETDEKEDEIESSSSHSDYFSAPDDLAPSHNAGPFQGLPSDDSEDDDFDPSTPNKDMQVKLDDSSSDFTSDSEDLSGLLEDEMATDNDSRPIVSSNCDRFSSDSKEKNTNTAGPKRQSVDDELSYLMETSSEPVSDKRHVERLDYKKLHDETYGSSSSDSSDEDFEDTSAKRRRRIGHEKTARKSRNRTAGTNSRTSTNDTILEGSSDFPPKNKRTDADTSNAEPSNKFGADRDTKRSVYKRLGAATTQRLYASFLENQYPERAVKENLANELGITVPQVAKWFENARWSFHHRPPMESTSAEKPPKPTSAETNYNSNKSLELKESSPVPSQNHIPEVAVESTRKTGGMKSESLRTKKRKGS